MRSTYQTVLAAALAVLPAASAVADFDISPGVSAGKIVTGGYEDATDSYVANVRVLDFAFDDFDGPTHTYSTEDPGFHPKVGSGFGAADSIVVSAVSGLSYYGGNGTGTISFTPVGTAANAPKLTFGYGSATPITIGNGYTTNSLNLGNVNAAGDFDRHLEASLVNGNGTTPLDGLYLLQLKVSDPVNPSNPGLGDRYTASLPTYILYSINDDDAVDPAKVYLRNTFAPGTALTPEPASLGALTLGTAGLLRRRRR